MPFTLSHTVAAIPLNKALGNKTALSPLLIGSMVPDMAYLTPYLVHQRMDSHSLVGIYLYCIPMGLTIYFLYHYLMAPVILSLTPTSIKRYLNPDLSLGKLPNISAQVLLFSLILGALTHVLWDFFTHRSGGIPNYIPWMDTPLIRIDSYDIMPYRVLQHLSSLLGLGLLIYWIKRWYSNQKTNKSQQYQHWNAPKMLKRLSFFLLFILSTIIGAIGGYLHLPETDVLFGMYSAQVFVRYAIVSGMGVFLLGCLSMGLIYQFRIRQENKNS